MSRSDEIIEAGWRRLRRLWRPSVRDDVQDEVAFHMEMRVTELMAQGLTRDDAERTANGLFGDVNAVSAGLVAIDARRRRRIDLLEWLDATRHDLRLGARFLRANLGFSLTAILTLTLGIGASTAIFSVVNAVLLRPLPYPNADRMIVITQDLGARGSVDASVSLADVEDFRTAAKLLDGVAAFYTGTNYPFSIDGDVPEAVTYASVTPNIFDVLGTPVADGRNFRPSDGAENPRVDDAANPGPPVFEHPRIAIISDAFWHRRFRGDSSVIGHSIVGPFGPTVIVGVASPNAELLFPARLNVERSPDVWDVLQRDPGKARRFTNGLRVVARMRPGVSFRAAHAQIDSISRALDVRFPYRKVVGLVERGERMHDFLVRDDEPA